MFSKPLEVAGVALITWGFSRAVSFSAGLMFAGAAIVFFGSVTDDSSVGMAIRRRTAGIRHAWRRQVARENGVDVPGRVPTISVVPCGCGGDENCPVCDGLGWIPDPSVRVNRKSPHPQLKVDPQAEELATRLARARQERAKLHDRTPALSRTDYNGSGEDDFERLA